MDQNNPTYRPTPGGITQQPEASRNDQKAGLKSPLWSPDLSANDYEVNSEELAATVQVLQKLRASLHQSGRTTPRTPQHYHNQHRRISSRWDDSPTVPSIPPQYTDPRALPQINTSFSKETAFSENEVHGPSQPMDQKSDTLHPLPDRSAMTSRRQTWRKSLLNSVKPSDRRTNTLMFGPGGPATEMDPMISKPDDWNPRGLDGNQGADPALVQEYLYKLAKALLLYGAPGHRIERYLNMTAQALKATVEFTFLPDSMTMYIEDPKTRASQAKLIRGAGNDLGRWLDTHNISKFVLSDNMTLQDAIYGLDEIGARKPRHNDWFLLFIYGLAGIGIAPFAYGARFVDLPLCFILSVGLGTLQLKAAPRNHLYSVLFEVSAAVLFSFIARMLGSIKNEGDNYLFCYGAISEAAINLIQPGYWITNAILELMNRQIATSGARLMYALVYALLLAYGVSIGSALYGTFHLDAVSDPVCKDPISPFWNLFFVPFFSAQVGILSGATWKQLPPMVFLTFAMYCAVFFTDRATKGSFTLAATMGGLTLGLLGNLYARVGRRIERVFENMFGSNNGASDPESGAASYIRRNHLGFTCAAAAMVPGMIVVVPSGLANRGSHLAGIIAAETITRNATAAAFPAFRAEVMTIAMPIYLNVIQIGIAISVGLSVGALVVYPFGKSRSWVMSW